ncbi:MAG: hypothetical protein JO011_10515 [Ktedonobacteraceae bacterium]|nr:hypothetical protein [Ktedonobacteraceae bacterium]
MNIKNKSGIEQRKNSADLTGSNFAEVFTMEGTTNVGASDGNPLEGTDLREIKGLTQEQLRTCKAKGAIIDEDPPTGTSACSLSEKEK